MLVESFPNTDVSMNFISI